MLRISLLSTLPLPYFSVVIVTWIPFWCYYGNVAAVYCSNTLRCSPSVVQKSCHLHQFPSIRGLGVFRKKQIYNSIAEVLYTMADTCNTNAKKVTHAPVLTVSGKSPQYDGNPFLYRYTQVVVCVFPLQNRTKTTTYVIKGDL